MTPVLLVSIEIDHMPPYHEAADIFGQDGNMVQGFARLSALRVRFVEPVGKLRP